MSGMVVFINLAGAVALLLWATRMVRTGIEGAYGNPLREKLRMAIGNRVTAAIAGFFFAIALQSATMNAAELLGEWENLGSLEAGKLADVVAVAGNPIDTISLMRDVKFVMKDGVVIKAP